MPPDLTPDPCREAFEASYFEGCRPDTPGRRCDEHGRFLHFAVRSAFNEWQKAWQASAAASAARMGAASEPDADLWYLQDTRAYVGNDVLWWAKDGNGYTTDVSKAHAYTREQAFRQAAMRGCDRAWPKAYIDGKTRPAVDMQYINHDDAMRAVCITPSTSKDATDA